MLKSRGLHTIVFALLFIFPITAATLNGQVSRHAHPLFHVQGTAQRSVRGLTPAQIKRAYGFDQISNQGNGQTIAIVNAFDHPTIEQDLAVFNETFDLPSCTTANRCFEKAFASGTNPGSSNPMAPFWALETAIDVEWAHAIAPEAKILLVETASDRLDDLLAGVDVAVGPQYRANVVSMSWGGLEFPNEATAEDGHFVASNVTFFAAAGDAGNGTLYPAASPYVMSVGGTKLHVDKDGNYIDEKAWSGSGGGKSSFEPEPQYQLAYPIPNNPEHLRGIPDVAYDADPNTGVAVYDSFPYLGSSGWLEVGGTSIGPPQWAALVAIANSMRAPRKRPLTGSQGVLYDAAQNADGYSSYNDIVKGRNGTCGHLCRTRPDYDYITGLGTPQADMLIPALQYLR
jgi:subtilase family serine protease